MPKTTFGAFNQGDVPKIAVFNKAVTPLGVNLDKLIAALQLYVDKFIVPVWATPAKLVKSTNFLPGHWAVVFLDDADVPGALAYHELTPDGLPLSKIFVRTVLGTGEPLSISTSHELVEMLVDPAINLMSTGPDPKAVYAYESADPVEALSFKVNGLPMSDFVYPAYFEEFRKPNSVKFDQLGKVKRPFELLAGGYQIIFKGGKWSNLFANQAKAEQFKREDRRMHRSEERKLDVLKAAEKTKIKLGEKKLAKLLAQPLLTAGAPTSKKRALEGVAGRPRIRNR